MAELVASLKGAGLWTGHKFRLFSGCNTIAGAVACGAGGTVSGVNFVNGDLAILTGMKGDGLAKRLTSTWAGNGNGQNDFTVWVWVTQAVSSDATARYYLGNYNAGNLTNGGINLGKTGANAFIARGKAFNSDTFPGTPSTAVSLIALSRQSSGSYVSRQGGTNTTVTRATDGNGAATLDFFARAGADFADCRLGAIGTSAGMTNTQLGQLETILTAYHANLMS